MVEKSGGPQPIQPGDKKRFETEYKHSADLFQRALEQYNKSSNPYQKEEFKQVMDKAMGVLNETARELKEKQYQEQKEKIQQDYNAFKKSPSKENAEKLNSDLGLAKGDFHYKGK